MQHIPFVGKVDRLSNGFEIYGRLAGRQRAFGNELPEGQALHEIHREEVLPIGASR